MEALESMSSHAMQRYQQRGLLKPVIEALMIHHDMDFEIGDGCRLLKVSRSAADCVAINRQIAEKLPRLAVIWSCPAPFLWATSKQRFWNWRAHV